MRQAVGIGNEPMTINVVNMDALIPREDFAVDEGQTKATPQDRIGIAHLDTAFFAGDLRKPDFQRETAQWSPAKVVDLIRSFLDADLIPAVILWRAGRSIFVIDGAHRLSAMLAWIKDDGDRKTSLDHAGGFITEEQRRAAERTRDAVAKTIGAYAQYKAFQNNRSAAPEPMQNRLTNLTDNSFIAQWVTATDAKSAEASFFKINQQGTPVDPIERVILKSRAAASAIAARAITHAGSGHKYWNSFGGDEQAQIEQAGKEIHKALYNPPITAMPLTTLDVPVAGRGYNALQFVFDLVNEANNVRLTNEKGKKQDTPLPADADGTATVEYLKQVRRRIERITGDVSRSLGLHPVVYFYTRSGTFQPTVFIAVSGFIKELASRNKLIEFTKHRRLFEDFLIRHKEATSLVIKQLGSGPRHIPRLREYYRRVLDALTAGKSAERIESEFAGDDNFNFVTFARPTDLKPSTAGVDFKQNAKTAAFFAAALPNGVRCALCGALVHKNSMQFDHELKRREGGTADMTNARVTHPYCNSIRDHLATSALSTVAAP